jgi:hypothetical protein
MRGLAPPLRVLIPAFADMDEEELELVFSTPSTKPSVAAANVYQAEQQSPERIVALKVIKLGVASDQLLRCFEQEPPIAAAMRTKRDRGLPRHADLSGHSVPVMRLG